MWPDAVAAGKGLIDGIRRDEYDERVALQRSERRAQRRVGGNRGDVDEREFERGDASGFELRDQLTRLTSRPCNHGRERRLAGGGRSLAREAARDTGRHHASVAALSAASSRDAAAGPLAVLSARTISSAPCCSSALAT